jgi:phosphohistidine phosphatase
VGVTVYFLRHGIAERQSPDGDSARRLTNEGKSELRRVLAFARHAQVKPELVLSSPYVRATETARLAMKELGLNELSLADALVPDSSPANLWNEVRTQGLDSVLVISHEPLLSATIAWVLGSSKEMVHVPPAGLVAIEFGSTGASPAGVLLWMITPELVPRLLT